MWEDGAAFDDAMNKYIGAEAPSGIDPVTPFTLHGNLSSTGVLG